MSTNAKNQKSNQQASSDNALRSVACLLGRAAAQQSVAGIVQKEAGDADGTAVGNNSNVKNSTEVNARNWAGDGR